MKSLNAYNNQLESMEFLNSLPNKDKLESINFFGNQVKEIDLAWLLMTYANKLFKTEPPTIGIIKEKNLNGKRKVV